MPGIAGILNQEAACPSLIGRMLHPMLHGATFKSGTLGLPQLRASVGWTCRPASFADALPVWNAERNVCLIFAGECFGNGMSGPAAVLNMYLQQGPHFVAKLNGWFSGVILDLCAEKVFLFNDRFGFRPHLLRRATTGVLFCVRG